MRRPNFVHLALLILAIAANVAAQGFKAYPGATQFTPTATEDQKKLLQSLPPGTQSTFYRTDDSFEKVQGFYQGFAKTYTMPGARAGRKLPTGQELKQAYFIFDGAADIVTSKSWATVQRPYVGSIEMKGFVPEYHDIRDITVITLTQKK